MIRLNAKHALTGCLTALAISLAGCASGQTRHDMHSEHQHEHKTKCGHKSEQHGDHTDYEHDGHHHRGHGDHTDECAGPHDQE